MLEGTPKERAREREMGKLRRRQRAGDKVGDNKRRTEIKTETGNTSKSLSWLLGVILPGVTLCLV